MKTLLPAVLLLVVAVAITLGFTPEKTSFMLFRSVPIKTHGLSEHGLSVVGPSDPTYEQLAGMYLSGISDATIEALKPFSVFVVNTSDKPVIAYKLKWEVAHANGKSSVLGSGQTNSKRILDTEDSSNASIDPKGILLCSVAGCVDVNKLHSGQRSAILTSAEMRMQDGRQSSDALNSGSTLDAMVVRLQQSTSIIVSLDGALFNDGTFVGADTTNLFAYVSSLVNADRDLLEEVNVSQGKGDLAAIQKIANEPKARLNPESNYNDYYHFNKQRLAQGLLRKVKRFNDQSLEIDMQRMKTPRLVVKKIN